MFGTRQLGQRWETYRPTKALLVWSCAVGAIGMIVVGFTWGGWVTGGTARTMAQNAAASGRDARGQLAALKELQSWDRGAFIEKGGWATMADSAKPTSTAARLCADQLMAL